MQNLSTFWNRSIIFAEIGYCSNFGTNINPGSCWSQESNTSALDLTAQSNCYSAFFQAIWSKQNWFNGVFFWGWTTDPNAGGVKDEGYTPNGKPSADVCKQYWS